MPEKLSPAQIRLLRLISCGPRKCHHHEWKSENVLNRLGLIERTPNFTRRITEAGRAALKDL